MIRLKTGYHRKRDSASDVAHIVSDILFEVARATSRADAT
jgi:hypothetical protein